MVNKIILFYFALFFVFSCAQKEDNRNLDTIEVLDSKNKDASIEQKIKLSKLISLDTPDSIFFAGCNKVIFSSEFIFVLDTKSSSIFKFDSLGKYILNFPKKGKGPGEVTDLVDFSIEQSVKKIVLYDRGNGGLIYCDFNGKLINQYPVSPFPKNLALYERHIVWFHNNNNDELNGKLYNISLSDQRGKVLSSHLEFPNIECPTTAFGGIFSQTSDGRILCSNGISNFIFEISLDEWSQKLKIYPKYLFHFGQIGLPDTDDEACKFFNQNYTLFKIAYLKKEFYELNDYTYFSYLNGMKLEFGFFSTSSIKPRNILTSENLKSNCYKAFLRGPVGLYDRNTIIACLTSEEISGIDTANFDCFSGEDTIKIQNKKTDAILALFEIKN